MKTHLWKALLVLTFVGMGCGGPGFDGGEGDETGQLEGELTYCDPSLLTWADTNSATSTCEGPWEYSVYQPCYKNAPNSACGVQSYQACKPTYPTCYNADFGTQPGTTTWNTTVGMAWEPPSNCVYECYCEQWDSYDQRYCEREVCQDYCYSPGYYYPSPSCAQAAQERIDYWDGDPRLRPTHYTVTAETPSYYYPMHYACSITFHGPVPTSGSGPQCGAPTGYVSDPSCPPAAYNSCRTAGNGLEDNQAACGDRLDSTRYFSAARQTKNQLIASLGTKYYANRPPICITGEADSVGTSTDTDAVKTSLIQTKATNLQTRLNNVSTMSWTGDKVALERRLVSNLKAVYELYGEKLTSTQQNSILGLYLSKPGVKHACSGYAAPTPPASGCDATTLGEINAVMDLCARLQDKGASAADLATRTDSCLDSAFVTKLANLTASCNSATYRTDYESFILNPTDLSLPQKGLMGRSFQTLAVDSSQKLVASGIPAHLTRIQKWYDAYRLLYPAPASTTADQTNNHKVWGATSQVLGDFWQTVYTKTGLPPPGTDYTDASQLPNFYGNAMDANRAILTAALTRPTGATKLPLHKAPLVQLLGDGLQILNGRLVQVGRFQDLGCRFATNRSSSGLQSCVNRKTEVSELMRFLASVNEPDGELATRLTNAPAFGTPSWTSWKPVFSALSTNAVDFKEAVRDAMGVATYAPELLAPRATTCVPSATVTCATPAVPAVTPTSPAAPLAKLAQDARLRVNSYDLTGLFDSSSQGILRAGVHQDRIDDAVLLAEERITELQNAINSYRTDRLTLANNALDQMKNDASQQHLRDQLVLRVAQSGQLSEDAAGLRNSIQVEDARFGDFMNAYANVTRLVAASGTDVQHLRKSVTVSAADAAWPATVPPNVQDVLSLFVAKSGFGTIVNTVEVKGLLLQANKGDILNITTTGTWAPTCTLKTTQETAPGQTVPAFIQVPADTETGPEGFLLTQSGSSYIARSNTSVHEAGTYEQNANSEKSCSGVAGAFNTSNIPIVGDVLGFLGLSFSASKEKQWCQSHDWGTSVRDTNSSTTANGAESRLTGAFSTGVRLPGAPFPQLPVGSLLLVEVKRGASTSPTTQTRSQILDVHVLQKPYSSIVVSEDADVYLVVNDRTSTSCDLTTPAAQKKLTLAVSQMRSFAGKAQQLGQGMGTALTNLRAKTNVLLEQGRVGPQQMTQLRTGAFTDLTAACSCDPTTYPPLALSLFNAFVDKQLATIERMVEVKSIERQLVLLALQEVSFYNDLNSAREQSRLLQLIPTWVLQDMDSRLIESKSQELLELMIADIYPIIDLRYSNVLNTLDAARLNPLIGGAGAVSWTGEMMGPNTTVSWAQAAVNAANDVVSKVKSTNLNQPPVNDLSPVAIGFRNTRYTGTNGGGGSWRRVDNTIADAVWTKIRDSAQTNVSITLSPTDLFGPGGTNIIGCNNAVPVITAAALYFVRPGESEEYGNLTTAFVADPNLQFPDVRAVSTTTNEGLVKGYRLANPDWLNHSIRVFSGEETQLEQRFNALTSTSATPLYRVANGLSPFTSFDITLPALRSVDGKVAPVVNASELVLVFRLQARQVASVLLPPVCK